MSWERQGLIFSVGKLEKNYRKPWMVSHSSTPSVMHLEDDFFRVFFSTRDKNNRSSISSFDFSVSAPKESLIFKKKILLSPGVAGSFDDNGCSVGSVVKNGNKIRAYYLGWNLGVNVPWRNSIGLAEAQINKFGKLTRYSVGPILDRNPIDPYSLSYPWVMKRKNKWMMWYGSNLAWGHSERDMHHVIKYAESRDGISWVRSGLVCIPCIKNKEFAVARPTVIIENEKFKMWFSYRSKKSGRYEIGYAESTDGIKWKRNDVFGGLKPFGAGWESQSVEYPCVFKHKKNLYMLYCGNSYGLTGIGIAKWR